jgi:hypothetical protein
MNYLITESQSNFLRRYEILDRLVIQAIEVVQEQDDICDYSFRDFLEEIKWQVSDKNEEHKLGDDIDFLHDLIEKHFYKQIRDYYDNEITPRCEEEYNNNDDDDDLDYYSGRIYGVDNNQ